MDVDAAPPPSPAGARAWARSGAMALCGRQDGPALGPPAPLVEVLARTAEHIGRRTSELGTEVEIDPLALLTERAAISGFTRRGPISSGGASRLLPTCDGWLAVTLARSDDLVLLPAWLGIDPVDRVGDAWDAITEVAAGHSAADLSLTAAELGLPVGEVGSITAANGPPVRRIRVGDAPPRRVDAVNVVDLSALWAGPLCGRLLHDAGARVVKVESSTRPDGARRGPAAFFDLMNAGKESIVIDFGSDRGRHTLSALLSRADVVIEASRPRALEALGIDAARFAATGPQVWLSITAYGRTAGGRHRVGFGDDVAAAGGAVVDDGGPCFCGDALADPVTGMFAAQAVLDALAEGGRWVLDAAMARGAAAVAGPTIDAAGIEPSPAPLPESRGLARELGADSDAVLRWLAA